MAEPKRPKLTLTEAKACHVHDLVDRLIDAPGVRAASIIRQLDRHKVDLALLSIVRSVDERWRIGRKRVLLPAGTEEQETMRRKIADILTANPEAIYPALLALSDAADAHDPRRRTEDAA
ncbi:hypothetical protein ACWIFB_07970 [Dietzia sp. NPDC055340]